MDTVNSRQAYEMHLAGRDAFDIAEVLRITVDEAEELINTWADSIPSPSAVEARRDEVRRVDTWLSRVNKEYIEKTIPISQAVLAFCRLSERRCRLLGIEAPSRIDVEATLRAIRPSSVDDEIASLVEELGINDPSTKR